jgi:protein-tyrosine phosphatase
VIDYSEIAPGLYQGSKPPEGGELAAAAAGFRTLVLCAREYQGGRYPGVAVLRCPLRDEVQNVVPGHVGLTTEEWRRAQTTANLVALRLADGPALVTCAAGLNRSGLVSALVLHLLTGTSGEACVRQVRLRRPGALTNAYFVAALESLTPIGSRVR